jgi:hypothetical protein
MKLAQQYAEDQARERMERVGIRIHGATDKQDTINKIGAVLRHVTSTVRSSPDTEEILHGYTQYHADLARELAGLIEEQIETGETA